MGYVAVIDTGIDDCSLAYKNVKEQYVVRENETQLYVSEEPATDNIGHGTEIANLIVKQNPKAELIIIRAFEQTLTSVDALISALDFLIHHGNIDFVNLSCGITSITNIIGLRNVCDTLLKRNTVLVSAFDNNGALSFPAAFDSVIGVDVTSKKKLIHKFQKSYVVNYFEENKFYRVTGLNNKKGIIRGTSYACAETTGKLSCEYNTLEKRNELLQQIKKNKINRTFHTPAFKIKKSIIFPLNKESDCIIRQKY